MEERVQALALVLASVVGPELDVLLVG